MTTENSGPAIRKGRLDDVGSVVGLHLESFPGFFLTFLGPAFLEILYSEIAGSPDGILLIAEQDGAVTGFVAGVTRQTGFYARLVRNRKWRFARASLGALVRRPAIAGRLLRALRRREEAAAAAAEACLMSIGVSPLCAGRGTGSALVRAFSETLRGQGVDRYCLTTDRVDNEAVNAFYRKLGFALARNYTTPEGRQMNEYLMDLKRSEG